MHAMTTLQKRFEPFLSDYGSQLLAYVIAFIFGVFVIMKLFSLDAMLQSNHRFLVANQSLVPQQNVMTHQLQRLEGKLTLFENAIKLEQGLAEDSHVFRAQLDSIKTELAQLKTQTTPAAFAVMLQRENQRRLTAKKYRIQTTKQKHHVKTAHVYHASSETLPFQVRNIDLWNGEPMLMVNHQGHTDLLSQQDTLAGWKVINMQFASGRVTFKNRQGRLVKLSLQDNDTDAN